METLRYETTGTRALLGVLAAELCGTVLMIVLLQPLHLDYGHTTTWSGQFGMGLFNAVFFDVGLLLGLPVWALLRRFGRGDGWSAAGIGFSVSLLALLVSERFTPGERHALHHNAALAAVAAACWVVGWRVAYKRA